MQLLAKVKAVSRTIMAKVIRFTSMGGWELGTVQLFNLLLDGTLCHAFHLISSLVPSLAS